MVAPMLTDLALSGLRAVDEAGLIHRARKISETSVRGSGATYTTTPSNGPWIPARWNPLSTDEQLRSDQPSAANQGWLSVPSGTAIKAGERWEVEGETGGQEWARTVVVGSVDFPRSHELRRRARCTGTESNP